METTARHALPLIAPGQAQKELTHNEALTALDMLAHPAVVAVGTATPPGAPAPGQCWVVGASPTGAWAGQADALACWTEGGWRFLPPREGLAVWTGAATGFAQYTGGAWRDGVVAGNTLRVGGIQVVAAQQAAIATPAGGTTVDAQARTAIAAILAGLRAHGLIAT